MSEPDNRRWLNEVGEELRQEVPVRAAWRARLLDDVAHSPPPSAHYEARSDDDERAPDLPLRAIALRNRGRRILISPLAGVAAAALFTALGAGAAVATMSWRARTNDAASIAAAEQGARQAASTLGLPASAGSADQEVVRFELAAPRASHVALVGSFNEWNPVATPLDRDPATGKWIVSLRLPPGRHVYAFVVDGDVTADPAAPRAADADFGSSNSVLLVAGKSS